MGHSLPRDSRNQEKPCRVESGREIVRNALQPLTSGEAARAFVNSRVRNGRRDAANAGEDAARPACEDAGARAPESAPEEEVRTLCTKRSTGGKPKVTASPKGLRSCGPRRWGGEQPRSWRTCRSVREELDSARCPGEPANEWRSPEPRRMRTGNGPAGEESRTRMQRARRKRTWKDIGWVETERQGKFRCGESGRSTDSRLEGRWKSEPP